jgi:tetratricopeptide (TPR) repeat protein
MLLAPPALAQDASALLKLDPASLGEGLRLEKAQEALRMAQQSIDRGEKQGQSLDLLLKVKELDPDLAQAEFELGRLYDDWRVALRLRAREHYQAYVTLRPKDSRGLTHLANLLSNAGLLEEAEKRYREATAADTAGSWPWNEYARFLVDNTDRYQEAVQMASHGLDNTRAQDLDNDAWPWRHRGLAYARLGQAEKARSDLARARAIFQRYNDSWQVGQIDLILAGLK